MSQFKFVEEKEAPKRFDFHNHLFFTAVFSIFIQESLPIQALLSSIVREKRKALEKGPKLFPQQHYT